MNGRRGAAGAVAAVLGILFTLLSASPAAAVPAGSFDTPGQGEKVTTSGVKLAGRFEARDGGRLEGNVVLEVAGQRFEKPVANAQSEPFDWTATIPENGSYEAVVSVSYRDWPYQLNAPYRYEMRRAFVVEAPPAPVKGITTKVNETERTVAVKWTANTEPDLLGYVVSRSYNKGAYTVLKAVEGDTTTYTDVLTDDNAAGSYRYQVRAVREGADPEGDVIVGDPGTSAATSVKTAPASGTTPTTAAGSSGSIAAQPGGAAKPATPLQSGKIDAAKFNNLLGEASLGAAPKDTSPLTPRAAEPIEEDGGFSDRLPYGPDGIPGTQDDGEGSMSLGVDEASTSNNERPTTLLSLAGAALAAMLVAITRWVLNEVKRSEEELATVEPALSAAVLAEFVDFEPPAEIVVEETPAPALPRRVRPLRSPMRPPRNGTVAHELVGTTAE